RATDACGNSSSCSQTVAVVDRSPPALACVPSRAVDSQTPWSFEDPVAFDIVDGIKVTVAIVSTTTNVICGNNFAVTRTWSATDSCGNSNRCSQTIFVTDTTPPTLTC